MDLSLEVHHCLECNCEVKVPRVLPYEGEEKPTGMYLRYMDEDYNEHTRGVLCFDCAHRLCNEGVLGIGYAGFPHSWDATLWKGHKPHTFPFFDKNEIQCECSVCTEEDEDESWEEWG